MFSEWSQPYPFLPPGEPQTNTLILRFRDGSERNERLSADGPSVYDRLFQVQVMAVGQKQSAPIYTLMRVREGKEKIEEHQAYARFKPAFEAYRQNIEPYHEGTPLEHWPLMTSEIVRAFKDANIFTVEMLSAANDGAAEQVRAPFFDWRAKAQAWLKDAKEKGGDVKARAENARLQQEVEELKAQVAQLLNAQNGGTPGFTKARRGAKNGQADLPPVTIADELTEQFEERV